MSEVNQEKKKKLKPSEIALQQGDILKANRIEANMMLNTLLWCMVAASFMLLFAEPLHVPLVLPYAVARIVSMAMFVTYAPIAIICQVLKGDRKWLMFLEVGSAAALLFSGYIVIGSFTALMLPLPAFLSVRYYNKKFTSILAIITVIVTIGGAFLHTKITGEPMVNDLLPKAVTSCFSMALCILLASNGKKMISQQADVSKQTARIETELNLATDIQMGMLPTSFPAFPDHKNLDLYANNVAAKEVGGDFYDYFAIDDDHVAIVIADVSGKGVGAALFMTISKILLKNEMRLYKEPAKALFETNSQLCENNDAGMFVTGWAGIYEISSKTLFFSNAGHNPPVVKRKGQPAEFLQMEKNFILALMPTINYKAESIKLEEGDQILLYTDGVTEANDIDGKMYGEERLLKCVNDNDGVSAEMLVGKVNMDIMSFGRGAEQFDDITMLCLKVQ